MTTSLKKLSIAEMESALSDALTALAGAPVSLAISALSFGPTPKGFSMAVQGMVGDVEPTEPIPF